MHNDWSWARGTAIMRCYIATGFTNINILSSRRQSRRCHRMHAVRDLDLSFFFFQKSGSIFALHGSSLNCQKPAVDEWSSSEIHAAVVPTYHGFDVKMDATICKSSSWSNRGQWFLLVGLCVHSIQRSEIYNHILSLLEKSLCLVIEFAQNIFFTSNTEPIFFSSLAFLKK